MTNNYGPHANYNPPTWPSCQGNCSLNWRQLFQLELARAAAAIEQRRDVTTAWGDRGRHQGFRLSVAAPPPWLHAAFTATFAASAPPPPAPCSARLQVYKAATAATAATLTTRSLRASRPRATPGHHRQREATSLLRKAATAATAATHTAYAHCERLAPAPPLGPAPASK